MAAVLACLAARAASSAELHELDGTVAYQEDIALGTKLWITSSQEVRMAAVILQCTGLDRNFPAVPSPGVVKVIDTTSGRMAGRPVDGVPLNESLAATNELMGRLIGHAFTGSEFEAWDAFHISAKGKRALAVDALGAAVLGLPEWVNDSVTGRDWLWPIAKVRNLADKLVLRAAFDAAFDVVSPGSAKLVAGVSEVPGTASAVDGQLVAIVYKGAEAQALHKALLAHLTESDREAYQRLLQFGMRQRWLVLATAFREFFGRPDQDAEGFCKPLGIQGCAAGSELHTALTQYKSKWIDWAERGSIVQSVKEIVRRSPEARCR